MGLEFVVVVMVVVAIELGRSNKTTSEMWEFTQKRP